MSDAYVVSPDRQAMVERYAKSLVPGTPMSQVLADLGPSETDYELTDKVVPGPSRGRVLSYLFKQHDLHAAMSQDVWFTFEFDPGGGFRKFSSSLDHKVP